MGKKTIFRWVWLASLLVAFSLGCRLVSDISEAVAVVTQVNLEELATEMGAIPTEFDLEGLATELQSFATEFDRSAFETQMSVMSTDMGAMVTEIDLGQMMTQMPALQGTLVAFVTPSGFPADIPLLEGERLIMGGTASQFQYAARANFTDAVAFYRTEMAGRGWTETPDSRVMDHAAVLVFQNGNRTAEVTIAEDLFFGVIVSIKLEG